MNVNSIFYIVICLIIIIISCYMSSTHTTIEGLSTPKIGDPIKFTIKKVPTIGTESIAVFEGNIGGIGPNGVNPVWEKVTVTIDSNGKSQTTIFQRNDTNVSNWIDFVGPDKEPIVPPVAFREDMKYPISLLDKNLQVIGQIEQAAPITILPAITPQSSSPIQLSLTLPTAESQPVKPSSLDFGGFVTVNGQKNSCRCDCRPDS